MRSTTWILLLITILIGIAGVASAEDPLPLLDYRADSWFLPQTPGVTAGPVGGFFNPAAFAMTARSASDLWSRHDESTGNDQYGFALGRTLNFGFMSSEFGSGDHTYRLYDYQLGLAKGGRAGSFGLAYRWATGETGARPRQDSLVLGSVSRWRWLSFGSAANLSLQSDAAQYIFDMGLRPFGRSWLTLFSDWTVNNNQAFFRDGTWSAGLAIRPVRGIQIGMRARERVTGDVDIAATLGIILNQSGFYGMPGYDRNGNDLGTAWLVRSAPPQEGMDPRQLPGTSHPRYRILDLEHKYLTYQKYRLLDERHVAWLDLLPQLEAMRDDPHLDMVVINLAGFSGRPSLLWEFRNLLSQIRKSGKDIIIQADRLDNGTLYLASVADRLSLDPQGQITIPGIALARSYLKGTLAKLGLGFQSHRYLKYKSAAETLSRDSMSAADREQRQRIVDVVYTALRSGITESRGLSPANFDDIVNDQSWLVPEEAMAAGLVDTLCRWDGLIRWLKNDRHARPEPKSIPLPSPPHWDEQWGQPRRIPVVYAVGNCAMDEGINGRKTSAYLRSLAHDPTVAAVVLRADSPGGDPLPSDLIAQAITTLRQAGKPVIVSQGDLAASGGYWISMNGTEILTTPLTITGSIGVISGWIWDDGFAAKLGISSDAVQRGTHADLFTNVNVPLLGGIPRRPMNEDELARTKKLIINMYHGFVTKVAQGRNLTEAEVDSVAQGRVWMGQDAIDHQLCDRTGGIAQAIERAKELANIPSWQEVEIVEYPPRPLFKFPSLLPNIPSMFGLGNVLSSVLRTQGDPADHRTAIPTIEAPDALGLPALQRQFINTVAAGCGQPLLMVDPDLIPEDWQQLH